MYPLVTLSLRSPLNPRIKSGLMSRSLISEYRKMVMLSSFVLQKAYPMSLMHFTSLNWSLAIENNQLSFKINFLMELTLTVANEDSQRSEHVKF